MLVQNCSKQLKYPVFFLFENTKRINSIIVFRFEPQNDTNIIYLMTKFFINCHLFI